MNAVEQMQQVVQKRMYSQPDPVSWLALADALEESGDEEGAVRWRRRAKLFAQIDRLIEPYVKSEERGLKRYDVTDDVFTYTPKFHFEYVARLRLQVQYHMSHYKATLDLRLKPRGGNIGHVITRLGLVLPGCEATVQARTVRTRAVLKIVDAIIDATTAVQTA